MANKKSTSAAKKKSTPAKKNGKSQPVPINRLSISGTNGQDRSINVKPIENGFLISESGTTGKGKNQKWYEHQYYSPTNPVPNINVPKGRPSFGKSKS